MASLWALTLLSGGFVMNTLANNDQDCKTKANSNTAAIAKLNTDVAVANNTLKSMQKQLDEIKTSQKEILSELRKHQN
jgi:septal ring factor EnvC (AmiA/AmiB activator)